MKDSVSGSRARERAQGGLVHQSAQCEMGEQEAPGFLTHKVRGLAVEHALGAPQMRLQFIERGLDFPALVIELRQLAARARARGAWSRAWSRVAGPAAPGTVYSITRTGCAVRSALVHVAFQRRALRYEPSAYRSRMGSVTTADARQRSAAPRAVASCQRSKLRNPRSAKQRISAVSVRQTGTASVRSDV